MSERPKGIHGATLRDTRQESLLRNLLKKKELIAQRVFSPVSKKYSLRIILTLVSYFDLVLQQMDVKTTFLNGDLEEEVYMKQPKGFSSSSDEHLVCKLKKSV